MIHEAGFAGKIPAAPKKISKAIKGENLV